MEGGNAPFMGGPIGWFSQSRGVYAWAPRAHLLFLMPTWMNQPSGFLGVFMKVRFSSSALLSPFLDGRVPLKSTNQKKGGALILTSQIWRT